MALLSMLGVLVAVAPVCPAGEQSQDPPQAPPVAEDQEPAAPRRELYSDDEIARLYEKLTPAPASPFFENGAETIDEDIIMLEPYVVEGDRGTLMPSIRRRLELGPESIQRRVEEMAPRESQIAEMVGRNTDAFFKDAGKLGPTDRPEMVRLTDREAARISRDVGNWIGRGLQRIFRK